MSFFGNNLNGTNATLSPGMKSGDSGVSEYMAFLLPFLAVGGVLATCAVYATCAKCRKKKSFILNRDEFLCNNGQLQQDQQTVAVSVAPKV